MLAPPSSAEEDATVAASGLAPVPGRASPEVPVILKCRSAIFPAGSEPWRELTRRLRYGMVALRDATRRRVFTVHASCRAWVKNYAVPEMFSLTVATLPP